MGPMPPLSPMRSTTAGVPVDLTLYEDARHELLNETNRDEVTADIVEWLRSRAVPA